MRAWQALFLVLLLQTPCSARALQVFFFDFPSAEQARAVHQEAVAALQAAGWWEFVSSNVDRIEYHNRLRMHPPLERAAGFATVDNGARVMAIAIRGRTAREIAQIMAHEAGHLEYWRTYGRFDEQHWAKFRENQFLRGERPGPMGRLRKLLALLIFPAMGLLCWLILLAWEWADRRLSYPCRYPC
jgi:hypothetical protein